MHMYDMKGQISVALIQPYRSSGTMLPISSWVILPSNHIATERSTGGVISVQTVTCTAGQHVFIRGPEAMGVLSAAGAKCASTTRSPPRPPWLQLSGTM